MKDFAHKLHRPKQPKPWTDVAREMTENLIFITLLVFIGIVLTGTFI